MDLWSTLIKAVAPIVEKVIKPIVKAIQVIVSNAQSGQQQSSGSGGSSHNHDESSDDGDRRGPRNRSNDPVNKLRDILFPKPNLSDLGQIGQGLGPANFWDKSWSMPTEEKRAAPTSDTPQRPGFSLLPPYPDFEFPQLGGNNLPGVGAPLPVIAASSLNLEQLAAIQAIDPDGLEPWSLGAIAAVTNSEAEFYRYTSPYAFWQWSELDDNPPTLGVWGTEGAMIVDLPEIDWPGLDDEEEIWTLPPDVYPDPDNLPEIGWPWPEDEEEIWTLPPDVYPDPDNLPEIGQPWPDLPEEERGPGSNILAAEEEADDLPDLSDVQDELEKSFEEYPAGTGTSGYCEKCADEVGQTLSEAGYEVDIVELGYKDIPPSFPRKKVVMNATVSGEMTSGDNPVGSSGYHEAVRITTEDGSEYFIDSVVYSNQGVQPVDWETYRNLWQYPEDLVITDVRKPGDPYPKWR